MEGDRFIENYVWPFLGANSEDDLIKRMVVVSLLYTLSVLVSMLLFPAPYGRYSSKSYGVLIPAKIAWIVQESPSAIVPLLLVLYTSAPCWSSFPNRVLVYCFLFHYIQRSFIFPLLIRGGKPTPLAPCASAFVFTLFNGFMQGYYLLNYLCLDQSWASSAYFKLGLALFITGMLINIQSDGILRNLRKPGETGYKIPTGGLFDYVSGANYFGEILEWAGFAVASWSPTAAVFALFTFCFLGLRAWHHHKFYKSKFEGYPKNRKIVIPYIL